MSISHTRCAGIHLARDEAGDVTVASLAADGEGDEGDEAAKRVLHVCAYLLKMEGDVADPQVEDGGWDPPGHRWP